MGGGDSEGASEGASEGDFGGASEGDFGGAFGGAFGGPTGFLPEAGVQPSFFESFLGFLHFGFFLPCTIANNARTSAM